MTSATQFHCPKLYSTGRSYIISHDCEKRIGTLPDAPSPRGGSCRYISRFASSPTKAVRQLQLTSARQADCLSPIIIAGATHVVLLHGQDTDVGILSERVVRSRDKTKLTKKKKRKEG